MKNIVRLNFAIALTALAMPSFAAPTVGRFLVRQQWPWHDKVEIEYTLSGVEGPVVDHHVGSRRLRRRKHRRVIVF